MQRPQPLHHFLLMSTENFFAKESTFLPYSSSAKPSLGSHGFDYASADKVGQVTIVFYMLNRIEHYE